MLSFEYLEDFCNRCRLHSCYELPEDLPTMREATMESSGSGVRMFTRPLETDTRPEAGWYATMGVNEDLIQAAKDSLRAMVEHNKPPPTGSSLSRLTCWRASCWT